MNIFLVGGAVRDELLNIPVQERDWVVVHASPDEMLAQGFTPVGKDFPVFLHPQTKEEYALARTERKTAPGYRGFSVSAAPDVTLAEDLQRRDLTINAIAKDSDGNLHDPWGGINDLRARVLRHVSDAFTEDPVRILRAARFAARFAHLGFTFAPETLALMRNMVANGEVDSLVPERVWKELSRALLEPSPHIFIETLRECTALPRILPEIANLFGVPQRPEHHPEVDTGVHTLLTLQQAASLSQSLTVRFATLTHDLGKALTPADILPRHHGHEQASLPLVRALCARLAVPNECRELALQVAQYHTHCHRALELKPTTLVQTLDALDAFRRPDRFEEFLLCCEADARGRTGFAQRAYPQADFLRKAHRACSAVTARPFIEQGREGAAIGQAIHQARVAEAKKVRALFSTA